MTCLHSNFSHDPATNKWTCDDCGVPRGCLHPTVFWNPTLTDPPGKPWECPDCHQRWTEAKAPGMMYAVLYNHDCEDRPNKRVRRHEGAHRPRCRRRD